VNKGDALSTSSRAVSRDFCRRKARWRETKMCWRQARMDLERYRTAWGRNGIAKQILETRRACAAGPGHSEKRSGNGAYDQVQVDFLPISADAAAGFALVDRATWCNPPGREPRGY